MRHFVFLAVFIASGMPAAHGADALSLSEFLPAGYVSDGTVSYTAQIQKAIDAAAAQRRRLLIPPLTFLIAESGLRLHSGLTLEMTGAKFILDEKRSADGAVFLGEGVTDVTLIGGEIVGRNDVWPDGVNIRGVEIRGESARLRLRDMWIHDLSSNGIGLFGSSKVPVVDVTVSDCIIENCCNRYPEYLSDEKWEKGSTREDQGLIAFYYVQDFTVRGCRLSRSRSDGTHFYYCQRGHIVDNRIERAKMGGFFLETCEEVLGSGNIVRENGSRGATIERGSKNCIFTSNLVTLSGREGLWAPDCIGLVVTSNIFDRNGRKPNGLESRHVWNANITINEAPGEPTKSPTQDYLVANNVIVTTASQVAAVRIDANETTSGIVLRNNLLRGDNRRILLEGARAAEILASANDGSSTTQE